jgi:transposase
MSELFCDVLRWNSGAVSTRQQIGTYVGMIPCEESSARKQRLGHISKQGSSLRFLLVEAAQVAARVHPDWRRRYIHLAMRRHKSIAKVAMGRKFGGTPVLDVAEWL